MARSKTALSDLLNILSRLQSSPLPARRRFPGQKAAIPARHWQWRACYCQANTPPTFRPVNNSLCDHVALHDSAKNIDQNRPHLFVCDQNLESFRHLLFRGTATDVEKIGGTTAVKLDDVHCRHSQACAVNETADISI